ncbi:MULTISPECIES: Hcp family type VI secretion system effector [Bradyrhizobium]|uniref:Hcp family type VI secretion system effector n=1 Tax=Bradyrhizobium TaxID=374 RepID=UPI0015CEFC8B|nr:MULTISPECIES: Hcp family type VI secretion system effector [Bradyrhizobium]
MILSVRGNLRTVVDRQIRKAGTSRQRMHTAFGTNVAIQIVLVAPAYHKDRETKMSLESYMTIKGKKQGDISKDASKPDSIGQVAKGDSGKQAKITVVAFTSGIAVPCDVTSGIATGARNHKPVLFTKFFDRASPLLWQALATNEVLEEVLCEFYRTDPGGMPQPQNFFKITWKNATLIEGKAYVPLTINPQNSFYQNMEDWSFTYKEVKWEHVPGSTSGEDKW